MAITLETVGDAIAFLSQFPINTRVLKAETLADGYTEIYIPTPMLYCVIETDGLIIGNKVIIDSGYNHYRDASGNAVGAFNAVVL